LAVLNLEHQVVGRDEPSIVRDDDQGRLPLTLKPAENAVDLVSGLGVEFSRRLIPEHEDRILNQRSGDGHALLLTSRHLVRAVFEAIPQTDFGQQLGRALTLLRGDATREERDQDVFDGRQVAD